MSTQASARLVLSSVAVLLAIWLLPLAATAAESGLCQQITSIHYRMIDTSDVQRLQQKHVEITHLEARFGRVFKAPIGAMKEYLTGIDADRKQELIKYEQYKDKLALEELDPVTYKGIEERFRRMTGPVSQRYSLNEFGCVFKNERCFTDGVDKANVERTLRYSRLDTQYYIKGKPSVVSCNYDRALGKFYLSDEELADLKADSPELAEFFASDMGWKNACIRIPFSTDEKSVVFDWKEFSKKVATAIWRTRRLRELQALAAQFDEERARLGCLQDGGAFEFTDSDSKPDVSEYALGEMRNPVVGANAGTAAVSPN